MKAPVDFYKTQKDNLLIEALHLKKKSLQLSLFRLAVFLGTSFLAYLTFGNYTEVLIITVLGTILFAFLVVKQTSLNRKRAVVKAKIKINNTEIDVLNRKFMHLDSGKEFVNPTHFYSNDIDLFGIGSFFQYINRTVTLEGKKALATTFTENKIENITNKQNAIKELSLKVTWRQHFSALASLVTVKTTSKSIVSWFQNYTSVLPKFLAKIQLLFSVFSIVLFGLVVFGLVSFTYLLLWFFCGLFITGKFLSKTSNLYAETDKVRETVKQYYVLLNEIEDENFSASLLKEKQQIITTETKKASIIFKEFSRCLDAFDQRNNLVIAVVGNGLFLTDIFNALRVEKWIANYKHTLEKWFSVIAFFDAQNSLANFHFNHTKFVFPEITSDKDVLKAYKLGHPLLDASKRIDNDFTIEKEQFFIITGANMAGKSTFLRTISLSIVMANCGLPVCAQSFKYTPIRLITSMRTTDSLTEDESYFYSELKRLKFIVDEIKTTDYFIILDEILKGTNSVDKAMGSKKFVEKLTKSMSTGIIATHDVSLCELENDFKNIQNFFFDADISNNELHFDYTLKNGICKNMNASFLLQKMGII